MNDEHEIMIYQNYFLSIFPNFLTLFSKWVQNDENIQNSLVIDLVSIHKISKQMIENVTHIKNSQNYMDYNSMVDDILEISPHYNYQLPRTNKKIKKNPPIAQEKSLILTRNGSKANENNMNNANNNLNNFNNIMLTSINKLEDPKLFFNPNNESSKLMMPPEFLPSFSYKDFMNFNQRSAILSPRPWFFESFKSFKSLLKQNDEITNVCDNRLEDLNEEAEEIFNKSSKKMKIFGTSISQSEADFWEDKK